MCKLLHCMKKANVRPTVSNGGENEFPATCTGFDMGRIRSLECVVFLLRRLLRVGKNPVW